MLRRVGPQPSNRGFDVSDLSRPRPPGEPVFHAGDCIAKIEQRLRRERDEALRARSPGATVDPDEERDGRRVERGVEIELVPRKVSVAQVLVDLARARARGADWQLRDGGSRAPVAQQDPAGEQARHHDLVRSYLGSSRHLTTSTGQ